MEIVTPSKLGEFKILLYYFLNKKFVSLLSVYPVGSIYLSASNTSPATLFGGTWQRINDDNTTILFGNKTNNYFWQNNSSALTIYAWCRTA